MKAPLFPISGEGNFHVSGWHRKFRERALLKKPQRSPRSRWHVLNFWKNDRGKENGSAFKDKVRILSVRPLLNISTNQVMGFSTPVPPLLERKHRFCTDAKR
ncbi:hypothetical protein TNCV_4686991 [Trichonephila clavipes]|nr:hypothetical protein TNCV_4686991 [Trichonephila clavipes]